MTSRPIDAEAQWRPGRRDLLKLGGALALAGAPAAHAFGAVPSARFDWRLQPPESAGMSSAGIQGIAATLQKYVDDGTINGVVSAVARHNKLVWYEAQGFRDPNARAPMRKDDIFRMMSSSKHVTGIAVLMMMDEGRLSLDDKVSRFIPSFTRPMVALAPAKATDASQVTLVPAAREITVRDLLTHTSGITSVGDKIAPGGAAHLVNRIERTPDDTLATYVPKLGKAVLDFQPGSKWAYSATDGIDVLLRIVEIVSGQTADVFLRERLFEPLDMRDTGFSVPAARKSRLLDIYARVDGKWVTKPHLFGDGPYLSGGGGLFGTVHDFMNLELMLLNRGELNGRRILKPETVALMSSNQVGTLFAEWIPPLTAGHGFGLTVRVALDDEHSQGRSAGAFGWGGAYGTDSWVEPKQDLAAVIFLQMSPPPFAPPVEFGKAIQRAIVA